MAEDAFATVSKLLELVPPADSESITKKIVVLRDEDFGYFCRRGVHVRMRNALDPATKTVKDGALWSEESLAPETLLYAIVTPRSLVNPETAFAPFLDALGYGSHYLQVGGNETVGEGWLKVLNSVDTLRATAGLPPAETAGTQQQPAAGGANGQS